MTKWISMAKDFVERNIAKRRARYKRRRNFLAKKLREDARYSQRVIPNKKKLFKASRRNENQMIKEYEQDVNN